MLNNSYYSLTFFLQLLPIVYPISKFNNFYREVKKVFYHLLLKRLLTLLSLFPFPNMPRNVGFKFPFLPTLQKKMRHLPQMLL